MQQPTLFDIPQPALARRTNPPTSKAAAKAVTEKLNELESIVIDALRKAYPGGLAAHEIASYTGLPLNTISPRTRPLVNKGFIVDSGEKRAGIGFRRSIVWRLACFEKTK